MFTIQLKAYLFCDLSPACLDLALIIRLTIQAYDSVHHQLNYHQYLNSILKTRCKVPASNCQASGLALQSTFVEVIGASCSNVHKNGSLISFPLLRYEN